MALSNEETRPLVGSRNNNNNNNGTNKANNVNITTGVTGGPRRRMATQPSQSAASQQQHQQQYYSSSGGGMEDFTKQTDRRTSLAKCCTSVNKFVCARPPVDRTTEYYEDTFNDEPWECTFGTSDQDGVWVNCGDKVGQIMSSMVWVLISYSTLTIALLAHNQNLPKSIAMTYASICALSLAAHSKTMFTDPGSIPREAVPRAILFQQGITTHAMCSHCQTYKPPNSHHCRICNRCISRMDHHCPWMNNCVGATNFKHFILFLCYTWIGCVYALVLFALNYFFCSSEDCQFDVILMQLVRVMTLLCIVTLLFVSSMIMNVTYGIMTGIGTIDRLKRKADNTVFDSDDEPIKLKDIFGIQGYWTWALPIDPIFEDYDRVMGYSIPQRLLREKQRDDFKGSMV